MNTILTRFENKVINAFENNKDETLIDDAAKLMTLYVKENDDLTELFHCLRRVVQKHLITDAAVYFKIRHRTWELDKHNYTKFQTFMLNKGEVIK